MGGDMAPKIDELIENIPKDQIEILRKIWAYFLQTKEWPKGKPFRKEQGRLTVERVVTNLKLIFIWHMDKDNPSGEYYRLTTEGVFAVEGFEGPNIKLLLSYLDYLRKKFDKNPAFEKVTATEVREILHKKSDDIRILGELLDMGNSRLWGRSASNLHSSDWEVGVIDDIEILYEANSSQEFLLKQWNDHIEWIITHSPRKTPSILGLKESQISESAMKFRSSDKKNSFEYDVFISHASEDKKPFVRSLAETLVSKGLRVWYDDLTLSLGDSLRRSIDYGLAKSRYGVVVLSKDFFAKEWPQKELDALVARENGRDKVILPIWHGVTKEEVQSFSAILADRIAVSADRGMNYVVNEILKVVSPTETDKNKNTRDIKELGEADLEETSLKKPELELFLVDEVGNATRTIHANPTIIKKKHIKRKSSVDLYPAGVVELLKQAQALSIFPNLYGTREPPKDLVPIGIGIANVGEVPAQGIKVFLEFPEDCKLIPESDAIGGLAQFVQNPTSGGLFVDDEDKTVARAWIDSLGNDLVMRKFGKIYVRFPEKEQEYEIKARIIQHSFPPKNFEFSVSVKPKVIEKIEYINDEEA